MTADHETETRSTRTDEGQRRCRRNAMKHGMTGAGLTPPHEECAKIAERYDQWNSAFKPINSFELWLLEQVATLTLRIERCQDHDRALRGLQAEHAALAWDDELGPAVEALGSTGQDLATTLGAIVTVRDDRHLGRKSAGPAALDEHERELAELGVRTDVDAALRQIRRDERDAWKRLEWVKAQFKAGRHDHPSDGSGPRRNVPSGSGSTSMPSTRPRPPESESILTAKLLAARSRHVEAASLAPVETIPVAPTPPQDGTARETRRARRARDRRRA